jgi:Tfp pilus assembly protein PilN
MGFRTGFILEIQQEGVLQRKEKIQMLEQSQAGASRLVEKLAWN